MHIGFEFKTDPLLQKLIGTLTNVGWSEEFNMSYVINNPKNVEEIFSTFRGIAWINTKYFFKNRPANNLDAQEDLSSLKHRDIKYERACPLDYIAN